MFVRILVPTDLSALSDAALTYAKTLARNFGGTVHLLHVLPNVFLRPVVGDPRALETAARNQLKDRVPSGEREQFHIVTAVERSDEPADEIISYASVNDIDLIVMATHGRHVMRTVAEKVVRNAPCPVLMVPAALPEADEEFRHLPVRMESRAL
jgi:nucleotide-binding universal stress UspA family protein